MRKPNPDPHPERSDIMQDDSAEGILRRQVERFLISLHMGDERGMHGAMAGLQAIIVTFTDGMPDWESMMRDIALDVSGYEERYVVTLKAIVKAIDRRGKWFKDTPLDVESGKEWRESLQ